MRPSVSPRSHTWSGACGAGAGQGNTTRRVWRAEHFAWWMTEMLHPREDEDRFARQLRLAQLRYVCGSTAAATSLAENYVGLERV